MNQLTVNQLIKMYQQGNRTERQKASNALWKLYKDWVERIVGALSKNRSNSNRDEMISESCVAFYNAVKSYDLSRCKECSLKTHAAYWINGFLNRYFRTKMHNNYVVPRCPSALRQRLYECSSGRKSISAKDKKSISIEFNTPVKRVSELELFFCESENVSYEEDDFDLHDNSEFLCQIDVIKLRKFVNDFISKQESNVASVLRCRWLKDKKDPYKRLAEELDQSNEKIRQIEISAFNQLLNEMTNKALVI